MPDPNREYDDLPPELVARLRRIDRAQPIVDPRTDREVIERARVYFGGRRWKRFGFDRARVASLAAAAAAIVVAFLVLQPLGRNVPDPDDVDGSGRVDILDAFALARTPDGAERSVALAARIVTLSARSDR